MQEEAERALGCRPPSLPKSASFRCRFDRLGDPQDPKRPYDSPEGRQAIDLGFARHQHIPSFSNWTPDDFENRPLEPGDIEAWWEPA